MISSDLIQGETLYMCRACTCYYSLRLDWDLISHLRRCIKACPSLVIKVKFHGCTREQHLKPCELQSFTRIRILWFHFWLERVGLHASVKIHCCIVWNLIASCFLVKIGFQNCQMCTWYMGCDHSDKASSMLNCDMDYWPRQ